MATIARSSPKARPKIFHGTGNIVRMRCCVCNVIVGEARARESVVGSSHMRAWCNKHLPITPVAPETKKKK